MAVICLVLCALATIGAVFLPMYEGGWGPEYYLDVYGVDCFTKLISAIRWFAVVSGILAIVLYIIGKRVEDRRIT